MLRHVREKGGQPKPVFFVNVGLYKFKNVCRHWSISERPHDLISRKSDTVLRHKYTYGPYLIAPQGKRELYVTYGYTVLCKLSSFAAPNNSSQSERKLFLVLYKVLSKYRLLSAENNLIPSRRQALSCR